MSYIIKKNDALVNLKLTNTGRRNLASGSLSFSQFGMGDSEVDYLTYDSSTSSILRPVDNNPDIMYPIPSIVDNYYIPITNLTSLPNEISQTAKERGFFNPLSSVVREFITTPLGDAGWVINNVSGNTADFMLYSPQSVYIPSVGDYIVLRTPYVNTNAIATETHVSGGVGLVNSDVVLTFQIVTVLPIMQGYTLQLDRALPSFPNFDTSECVFYKGPNFISDYLDKPNPITYWNDEVLNFNLNGVTTYDDVPVWNFNLVLIDDMIGVNSTVDKNLTQTKGKEFLGTSVLFNYYRDALLDKIGVIHYTNNTVSNWYAEGFYQDTFILDLPTVLWHKKQFGGPSLGTGIGYTFICDTLQKSLDGKIKYYDLIDQELIPTVVGKVYVDYKICIIEHPELLMAMSIKGNRNWTLPKLNLILTEPGTCVGSNNFGSIRENESLHVSYMMYDTNGIKSVHCNDFSTVTIPAGSNLTKDVIVGFPKDINNPLYNEFPFLKDYSDTTNKGFKSNRISLLTQKTIAGHPPVPALWNVVDVTNYLGTSGCINQNTSIFDEFTLATETLMGYGSGYTLNQKAIGEIIVASNGLVKLEADSTSTLSERTPYFLDKTINTVYFDISMTGPTQIYYLAGKSLTSFSRIQKYITQHSTPVDTYSGLYINSATNKYCIHLDYQPSNDVVYLFYNGQLISSNNYTVYNTGSMNDRRVELNFVPYLGSNVLIFYIDAAGVGINPALNTLTALNFNNLRVFIDKDFIDNSLLNVYNLRDYITIPKITDNGLTFGDEEFLLGNINTDIKATIYKSLMTCNILPNQFISSTNPTWNANLNIVQFSELGIYDNNQDLVAIGKFSQPIKRKYNSDILVIQATIDF